MGKTMEKKMTGVNMINQQKYKPIANKELIIQLYNLYNKYNIIFIHVKAHKDQQIDKNSFEYKIWYGNKKADSLAVQGSKMQK